ncbi:hypothetical protein BEN48_17905 [Hymenobacter glacialis]|uniref:Uncharacterized protein n=1 Tax=Hymenobacter glacialis TaxID=1908236 RepID=A0A1G1T9Q8_9BACT|nr:hypothetical protein BEN48_17905 [Hymenobacter glacialis]
MGTRGNMEVELRVMGKAIPVKAEENAGVAGEYFSVNNQLPLRGSQHFLYTGGGVLQQGSRFHL